MTSIELLKQTIVLIEDRRFYSHHGVDLIAIARACLANLSSRRYSQGGSTITQQLARTLYLDNRKTITRKLKEVAIALWLEFRYSKEQILDMYVRLVYMGHTATGMRLQGMKQAAFVYTESGNAMRITLAEIATLVAMLRGPNLYRPGTPASVARRVLVLSRLLDASLITQAEFFQASAAR